jgi:hypothetical protein
MMRFVWDSQDSYGRHTDYDPSFIVLMRNSETALRQKVNAYNKEISDMVRQGIEIGDEHAMKYISLNGIITRMKARIRSISDRFDLKYEPADYALVAIEYAPRHSTGLSRPVIGELKDI